MNSVGKLILTLAGLCELFSCGGGSGGGSVVSTAPTSTSTYVQQKPQVPNFANLASLTLADSEKCWGKCLVVSNGADELKYRVNYSELGMGYWDKYAKEINGGNGTGVATNDLFYYSNAYSGPYFYLADVYYRTNYNGTPSNVPSAFYGRLDYAQESKNAGYKWVSGEFKPLQPDAHWVWNHIQNNVQYSGDPKTSNNTSSTSFNGEKIESELNQTGTIELESNGHWSANFINGKVKLDGAINGSDVSGESHFTHNGQTIDGKFIGSDGILEDERYSTGGAFAGSNDAGTQVYAGSWWNDKDSVRSIQQ